MHIQRYMMKISYRGSNFLGFQKLTPRRRVIDWDKEYQIRDRATIQGVLEHLIVQTLKPAHEVVMLPSSRTDSGVHAWGNAVCIDLAVCPCSRARRLAYFDPKDITKTLNLAMLKADIPIRIVETFAVPFDFRPRQAKRRTYVYKLFLAKNVKADGPSQTRPVKADCGFLRSAESVVASLFVPHDVFLVGSPFNFDVFAATLDKFVGVHNFAAFCQHKSYAKLLAGGTRSEVEAFFTRHIESIDIDRKPLANFDCSPMSEHFDLISITIRGRSFLHSQIRRMIGGAFGVSSDGPLNPDRIDEWLNMNETKFFLDNQQPSKFSARGLTLADVEYASSPGQHQLEWSEQIARRRDEIFKKNVNSDPVSKQYLPLSYTDDVSDLPFGPDLIGAMNFEDRKIPWSSLELNHFVPF